MEGDPDSIQTAILLPHFVLPMYTKSELSHSIGSKVEDEAYKTGSCTYGCCDRINRGGTIMYEVHTCAAPYTKSTTKIVQGT